MVNTTGIYTGWVLVHDGEKVLVTQYNENQETTCIYTIETFETEQEMQERIADLGLMPLQEGE